MAQQEVINEALTQYLEEVRPLGVVTEVMVGVAPGKPVCLFNVVKDDFSKERAGDPKYAELRRFGSALEMGLEPVLDLFVSSVALSRLPDFLKDCAKRGFELKRIPVAVNVSSK